MPSGIITKGIGGFYYVTTPEAIYECKARGIFRKDGLTPLPGDRVLMSVVSETDKTGSIDEILPRESQLVRPAVANVNQVVVVMAVKSPEPDLVLLDKMLVTIEDKGLDAVICINKIDLDEGNRCEEILDTYRNTGYRMVMTSSKANTGLDQLKGMLADRITVFAGQSGVGKSTILNRIVNMQVMKTGEVSEKIERGKHTTRHAELIKLDTGGYLVDTPGFSSYELTDVEPERLQLYFPEFDKHLGRCRFTGCSHISEPDCCVKAALNEGLISSGRYQRYVQLFNVLKQEKDYKRGKKT